MIGAPLNDAECLGQFTELAAAGCRRPDLQELARRFGSTSELVAWIRSLPQRDDVGDPNDGPQVSCTPSQRARFAPADPNCVERSLLYLTIAELLDPRPFRCLATIDLSIGRHTFPVEEGVPVVLDAKATRNALDAGIYQIRRNAGGGGWALPIDPAEVLAWILRVAEEPARALAGSDGQAAVQGARQALNAVLSGAVPSVGVGGMADIEFVFHVAAQVAPMWGADGVYGVELARRALEAIDVVRSRSRNLGGIGTDWLKYRTIRSFLQTSSETHERRNLDWDSIADAGGKIAIGVGKGVAKSFGIDVDSISAALDPPKPAPAAPASSASSASSPSRAPAATTPSTPPPSPAPLAYGTLSLFVKG